MGSTTFRLNSVAKAITSDPGCEAVAIMTAFDTTPEGEEASDGDAPPRLSSIFFFSSSPRRASPPSPLPDVLSALPSPLEETWFAILFSFSTDTTPPL